MLFGHPGSGGWIIGIQCIPSQLRLVMFSWFHLCIRWNIDLLMTDVPDLVRDAVVAPIGNLDHSSQSAVISMAQAVPNLCVGRKVVLKHEVNRITVCGAIQIQTWYNI